MNANIWQASFFGSAPLWVDTPESWTYVPREPLTHPERKLPQALPDTPFNFFFWPYCPASSAQVSVLWPLYLCS